MNEEELKAKVNETVEKLRGLISEGAVSRVKLVKDDKVLLNLPMPAGVLGAVVGLAAAPVATVAAALVSFGMDCEVIVEKPDGSETNLNRTEAGLFLESVKGTVREKAHEIFDGESTPIDAEEAREE